MFSDTSLPYAAGIFEPSLLLRAIAGAVANAQQEIDEYQFALIIDASKMGASIPLESITAVSRVGMYRIAELALEYTEERTDEGRHRSHAVLFRVTSSAGQAELIAELVIDGRTKEALIIPKEADSEAG